MRLFVGLTLPDPITTHLGTLRGSLPSVQWNNPDTYHLTLNFVGEIRNYHIIDELDLALEKINFPKFNICIQGVNHFTSPNFETILWASVVANPHLLQLKKKIDHILHTLTLPIPKQQFLPHVTLAKGYGLKHDQISNWLYKYNLFKTECFEVCQFSLISSYPNKNGPIYNVEENYSLS